MSELHDRIREIREAFEADRDTEDRQFDRAETWAEVAVDAERIGEYTLASRLLEIAGSLHVAFRGVTADDGYGSAPDGGP